MPPMRTNAEDARTAAIARAEGALVQYRRTIFTTAPLSGLRFVERGDPVTIAIGPKAAAPVAPPARNQG